MKRTRDTATYHSEKEMREIESGQLPANLAHLLTESANRYGHRNVAVFFDDDTSLTYGELAEDVNRLASALSKRGVSFGHHVGIMLKTCRYYPVAWLAVVKLGAVAVPINTANTAREISFLIMDAHLKFLIIQEEFEPFLDEVDLMSLTENEIIVTGEKTESRYLRWNDVIATGESDFVPTREPTLDDPANIQYTSGTTGMPKGAIIPHGFWVLRGKVWKAQIHFQVQRNLIAQPLHYIDGQAMFLLAMTSGATAYIAAKQSSSRFLSWIAKFQIEFCSLPEIIARKIRKMSSPPQSLKIVYAYSHRKDSYRLTESLLGCPLRQGYGMTELGSTLYVPVEADHMTGSGTAGIPSAHREVKIVDDSGSTAPDGQMGEIFVRGLHIFKGYYNRPEATEAAFTDDGWFRTGDLGVQDKDGWFFYLGRRKDMVRRSSENISAQEVEEVLRGVPGVIEAAVVPVPDDIRGEEVKAYIRLENDQSPIDVPPDFVIGYCTENLARYKLPRFIEYVEDFPRTPGNKIKKSDLIAAKTDLRTGTFDATEERWII